MDNGPRARFMYLPPEEALGGEASAAGDMWAFGTLLFEYMTGALPLDLTHIVTYRDSYEEDRDEYLLQLCSFLDADLPPALADAWARRRFYVGRDGVTLLGSAKERRELREAMVYSQATVDAIWPEGRPPEPRDLVDIEPETLLPEKLRKLLYKRRARKGESDSDTARDFHDLYELLYWMWKLDPAQRPSAAELLKHDWFKEEE
jgi:serine/threonine protein kinase